MAWAGRDSPAFQRQSREFAEAVTKAGRLQAAVVGERFNHSS